jgi:hypothetical protein
MRACPLDPAPLPVELEPLIEGVLYLGLELVIQLPDAEAGLALEELQALEDALGVPICQLVWVFDFLGYMSGLDGFDGFYFWKINNQGCKHLQVRFSK